MPFIRKLPSILSLPRIFFNMNGYAILSNASNEITVSFFPILLIDELNRLMIRCSTHQKKTPLGSHILSFYIILLDLVC